MPTVLLSALHSAPAADVRGWLSAAGFAVRDHALGSAPAVDFAGVAVALVVATDQPEAAAAQTRRWRAELGDEHLPIVWLTPPGGAASGLAAGADAVLTPPVATEVLAAQVRSALRSREAAGRVAARAAEARLLGEQLNRSFAQAQRELDAARRVRLALLPGSLPEVGGVRFAVSHHPRSRTGGDFYAVHPVGHRVVLLVGDVVGPGAVGGLLGRFVAEVVSDAARAGEGGSAGVLVAAANRGLLRLGLDDPPLVALLVGVLNAATGELEVARAGIPAPVFLPAAGGPELWSVPGPFLGVSETTYPVRSARLRPRDRLLIGTDGTRPAGDPNPGGDAHLIEAAGHHRELSGQRYVDAVAADLLARVAHDDDFTLLGVEYRGGEL